MSEPAAKVGPTIAQIEEDLEFFDDWEDRYRYLMDLGRNLPGLPEDAKVDANLVRGCTSQVWLVTEYNADRDVLELHMDSDALIVRGLVALVRAAYSGTSPAAICSYDINALFERLDLLNHLSMTRGNGLRAMVARITEQADRHR